MRTIKLTLIAILLLTTACIFKHEQIDKDSMILASVDGKSISGAQLDSIAESSNIIISDTTNIESLKAALLDSLIDLALIDIRIDSMAAELEYDREFLDKRTNDLVNVVLKIMYQGEIVANVSIDSSEIVEYYQQNLDKFIDPEQVKAAHILIKIPPPDTAGLNSEDKKKKAIDINIEETIARAKAVYERAKKGENWDSLVVKYSQDRSNNQKGGDLGYFPRGRMVPAFDSASFAANIGDIIGPVKTSFGYHIIRIDDHKSEVQLELDKKLFDKIKTQLSRAKEKELTDKFVDSLKTNFTPVYNEEILNKPDSSLDPNEWVMIVNEKDTVFENEMQNKYPKYLRMNQITEPTINDKKNFLQEIAINPLLRAAGKSLGYYDDPKVIQVKDEVTRKEASLRVKHILRNLEYQPSEEEMEQYYKENFEKRYREKKPLHVQHIIFKDSSTALIIRDSLEAGADFKTMALKYYPGEPEIREVAYDLGYISEQELGEEFFSIVNSLDKGSISLPFKTEWGYHIAKLVDRKSDKKLNQVKPGIKRALIEQADSIVKRQVMEQWRANAEIVIDTKTLNKYKFPETIRVVEIAPKG